MAPRYGGKCRKLTESDRARFASSGRKPSFRFKIDCGEITFDDVIRGPMRFDSRTIGDFIIVRSNGIPAYNFAVVIDDHYMNITHVIRGEDHLSNTALQILLYRAFGFKPPRFAHHSLILGKDRSKLSKRHGSVSVKEFRNMGVIPDALLNYLSLLGSSFTEGREIRSVEEIIREFSLDRAGKSGAIFDEDKLKWINGIYIRNCEPGRLMELLTPFIRRYGYDYNARDCRWWKEAIQTVRGNLTLLSDIERELAPFFEDKFSLSAEADEIIRHEQAIHVLRAFHDALEAGCPEGQDHTVVPSNRPGRNRKRRERRFTCRSGQLSQEPLKARNLIRSTGFSGGKRF